MRFGGPRELSFGHVSVDLAKLFVDACFKDGVEVRGFLGWGARVDLVASDTAGV